MKNNHFHASISDNQSKVSYTWDSLLKVASRNRIPKYDGEAGKSIISNKPGLKYETKEVSVILTRDEIKKLILEELDFLEVDILRDHCGSFYEISNIESYIEPNINIVI